MRLNWRNAGDLTDRQFEDSVLRLLGYGPPDELWVLFNPRRNPNDLNGDGVVDENDNPNPDPDPDPDDGNDDSNGGSTPPTGSPVGTDPGEQTPDNTIPSGTDPSTLPDGEYYDSDGNHVIVSTGSNGTTTVRPAGSESGYYTRPDGTIGTFDTDGSGGYVPPGLDNPAHFSDTPTPFSHDPDDDVSYVVSGDGQVVSYQDGHTYRVNDDDLADAVRTALATGDASGLSSVDRVSVYDAAGHLSASNYEHHAGSEHHAESAEEVLREFTSVDEQEEWFRGPGAQPAGQSRSGGSTPAGTGGHRRRPRTILERPRRRRLRRQPGQPRHSPNLLRQPVRDISTLRPPPNQGIAQANSGLTPAPADPEVGRRFEADQGAIAGRLSEADAIDDPAQLAAAQAAVAADLLDLQQRWANADTQGWSFAVEGGRSLTAADYWQEWADGVEEAAGQNQAAAEHNAASHQAVADFNAAVAPGALSPADYARLAEEWRNRPDNHLVSVLVDDLALAEGGGVVHQTPSGYFARLSGDPALIAAEEQSTRARVETREAVEAVIGEVAGPLTQEHVDEANRVIGIDTDRADRRSTRARVETREAVEAVIGEVAGPLTQEHVDEANRVIGID